MSFRRELALRLEAARGAPAVRSLAPAPLREQRRARPDAPSSGARAGAALRGLEDPLGVGRGPIVVRCDACGIFGIALSKNALTRPPVAGPRGAIGAARPASALDRHRARRRRRARLPARARRCGLSVDWLSVSNSVEIGQRVTACGSQSPRPTTGRSAAGRRRPGAAHRGGRRVRAPGGTARPARHGAGGLGRGGRGVGRRLRVLQGHEGRAPAHPGTPSHNPYMLAHLWVAAIAIAFNFHCIPYRPRS